MQSLVPGILVLGTPTCLIGRDEMFFAVNQAYLDITGRQAHEVIGNRVQDLVSTPGYEVAKPYLDYALLHGQATSFTRLWKNRAGESKWISVSYNPFRNEKGGVHGVVAQVTQLQDVQALGDAFIERERLLRHLTDDTGRPILYVDEGLILRFVNKPFLAWIEAQDPDLLGKHVSAVLSKEVCDFYVPYVQRCLQGEAQKVETLSLALVGAQRHLRMEFLPDFQPDGRVSGVYIIGNDIEEDFQLRQSLILKEREIRSVIDSIDMPISKSDRSLRYLYVNQVACDWFGRPEATPVFRISSVSR